jgi:hypothetical protein
MLRDRTVPQVGAGQARVRCLATVLNAHVGAYYLTPNVPASLRPCDGLAGFQSLPARSGSNGTFVLFVRNNRSSRPDDSVINGQGRRYSVSRRHAREEIAAPYEYRMPAAFQRAIP